MTELPSADPLPITLVPLTLVEELAERVAERVLSRVEGEPPASPWLSTENAATYLDWPKERLYKLTASGEIPHYKHNGRILFRRDELDYWLADYHQGPRRHHPGRLIRHRTL